MKTTIINGCFAYPIGISFLHRSIEKGYPGKVTVSTVCLDGAHERDLLGICEPESGYETMVFLDGCSFFHVFKHTYQTAESALAGHDSVVAKILDRTLEMAIPLHYYVFGNEELTALTDPGTTPEQHGPTPKNSTPGGQC